MKTANVTKEKRYLNPWQIFSVFVASSGYSFGQTLITGYALLFMTDYVGMSAGIVAMLMAVSKVLDGVSDVIAGAIIDNTKSKLGRARVWMLRMIFPMALIQIAIFSVPDSWGSAAVYVYFFICYTLFNAVLNTMFGIAYSTLPVYITRNKDEQVGLSICNFAGGTITGTLISAVYLILIDLFGGGTAGWQKMAVIFGIIFVILELVCILSVKELPRLDMKKSDAPMGFKVIVQNFKYLLTNRYFLMQLGVMILYMGVTAMMTAALPYYAIYVLQNKTIQGVFTLTSTGIILGLLVSPVLIKKMGIYKSNIYSRIAACILYLGVVVGSVIQSLPIMLIFLVLFYICCGPYLGSVNTLVADISAYSLRKDGVSIDASVFSCNSMGTKVGNAIGVAIVGWLLEIAHYNGMLDVQPDSALKMITFLYIVAPLIVQILITTLLCMLRIEKANTDWDAAHPEEAAQLKEKIARLDEEMK